MTPLGIEEAFRMHLERSRTQLLALRHEMSPEVYSVLWTQLLYEEALFLRLLYIHGEKEEEILETKEII